MAEVKVLAGSFLLRPFPWLAHGLPSVGLQACPSVRPSFLFLQGHWSLD